MEFQCDWLKKLLPVLILVFVIWPNSIFSATVSWWIVVVSAALLLVHQFACKKCCNNSCEVDIKEKPKRKEK